MEDTEKIRRDMMELWKETFHDSSRYIRVVFDNYFTPENVFTSYHENRLIASLLCVPYEFQILAADGKKRFVKGMYLCGLATRPEYRRRGIMSKLMYEAEKSIKERGYTMTFLIPADSHLREYYRSKGYHDASYRMIREIANSQNMENTSMNIYSIHSLFDKEKIEFVEKLAGWCHELERKDRYSRILHSRKDMMAIMAENENSIFLTDDTFDLNNPNLAKVVAVAFPDVHEPSEKEEGKVMIVGMYLDERQECRRELGDDSNIRTKVENAIRIKYPSKRVEMIDEYDGIHIPGKEEMPYAMVKKINTISNTVENENIIFKISLMLD